MELIQKLIHDEAVQQLRKKKAVSPHDPPDMEDGELDHILFYGGIDQLRESFDKTARINVSDITQFEQQMSEIVSDIPNAVLKFDKQKNGYSIMLKNEGETTAVASGSITLGNEGSVMWMFSLMNGFRFTTEGLNVTQSNRDLIANIFDYYNTWQKDWRQKLIAPDGGASMEADQQVPPETQTGSALTGAAPDASGQNAMNV